MGNWTNGPGRVVDRPGVPGWGRLGTKSGRGHLGPTSGFGRLGPWSARVDN